MTNFLYNPDRKSKSQLIAEFVVRNQILDEIMQDLESSDMTKPEQHYLLVGQRGTGKTTLLHRIKYAVEDSAKLKDWLIPVIFSEEQYNISELANLWENVAHVLEDYHGFEGLSVAMEAHITRKDFEEKCYEILEKVLVQKGKKLILLIDNVGDLLRKLDDIEVRRLREILQTKHLMRLVAGSPFYLDSILDYKQPFFEFFKVMRLEGLNKEEAQELLRKLGEVHGEKEKIEKIIKETPERIETLRILTGGVPRTIGLMFQIFIDYEHESSLKDLERVLDAVTPLYKHRMDDLPKQQQKIVDAVARNWEAISVKELKEKVRLESKVISAQLRQLEKNQIIEKRETSTKNHLYLLKERFWNIWYLMRYCRKDDSQKVVWLVKIFEIWFNQNELEERINEFISKVKSQKISNNTISLFGEVYSAMKNISPLIKLKLKDVTPVHISKKIELSNKELANSIEIYFKNESWSEVLEVALKLPYLSQILKQRIGFATLAAIENEPRWITNLGKSIIERVAKTNGSNENEKKLITPSEFFIIFSTQDNLVFLFLNMGNHEVAMEAFETLVLLHYQEQYIEKYEQESFIALCAYIIFKDLLNPLYKIFTDEKAVILKKIYPTIYYALLYLRFGHNSDEYNKIPTELKEPVLDFLNRVNSLK